MKNVNQVSNEDGRIARAAMTVVISASIMVYATGFLYALHTHTYFMMNLFTVEAIIASVAVYWTRKFFR